MGNMVVNRKMHPLCVVQKILNILVFSKILNPIFSKTAVFKHNSHECSFLI